MTDILFQSTPSGGKATPAGAAVGLCSGVSIHAFRGEGDNSTSQTRLRLSRFNPRLPGGRRHVGGITVNAAPGFNPRLPGGRRLISWINSLVDIWFQSTPSGGKATKRRSEMRGRGSCFNPRLPGGRRRRPRRRVDRTRRFNPRLPGGRRLICPDNDDAGKRFQSTPSGGKATRPRLQQPREWRLFQSTPSGGKATAISRVAMPCFRQIL